MREFVNSASLLVCEFVWNRGPWYLIKNNMPPAVAPCKSSSSTVIQTKSEKSQCKLNV